MSCPNLLTLQMARPPDQVLRISLQPVWLIGWSVFGAPTHHFSTSPDQEVLVMDWTGLWVGSPFRKLGGLVVQGVNYQVLC